MLPKVSLQIARQVAPEGGKVAIKRRMRGAAHFNQFSDSRLIHGARTTTKLRNLSVIDRSEFAILAPSPVRFEIYLPVVGGGHPLAR